MKKSELRNIIKEEIKNIFEIEDPTQSAFRDAMKRSGAKFEPSTGNKLKEKEYTFTYARFINVDDYDFEEITVTDINPENAREKAFRNLKSRNIAVRGGIEGLELIK